MCGESIDYEEKADEGHRLRVRTDSRVVGEYEVNAFASDCEEFVQ
jgi:hypothetical protein